jgi:4-amino-4-deoxychorismate lyase
MCRLFETIHLNDGAFRNLNYHQVRIEKSVFELFGVLPAWSIHDIVRQFKYPKTGLYKVRVIYNSKEVLRIEFLLYQPRHIESLKVIEANIDYAHKYEDREALASLFEQRDNCDEILIVKDGFITDSSIANLVFKKNKEWFTPTTFLLNGTMRAHLLNTGKIKLAEIRVEDLSKYESCKTINAMLGFDSPEIPIHAIR